MNDWLDRAAARRGFERRSIEDALAREVARRVVERLQYIKLDVARVLDVGCGAMADFDVLRQRYPRAQIVGVDWSAAILRRALQARSVGARVKALFAPARDRLIAADAGGLPFAAESFDLVWSNMGLAWATDPAGWLREWQRVLKVGGLLMFTTCGPDTLRELRESFAAVDEVPHVHPFIDMHDLGDALVGARFADPVMDMEMLTLTYADVDALLRELHATGQRNAHRDRRRGLTGVGRWKRMREAYTRGADGRIGAKVEVVYGHAWKAAPRKAPESQIIRFQRKSDTVR